MANLSGPNPGLNTIHELLIAEAASMQSRYVIAYPSQPLGGFFFREAIDTILSQTDCIGVRYYYVIDEGVLKIILLGVRRRTYIDMLDVIFGNAQTDPPYINGSIIPIIDQLISLTQATDQTTAYRVLYPGKSIGGFFFRSIVDDFIDVDDVIGIRYKFGINSANELKIIFNPVNSVFKDMDMFNIAGQKIKGETSNGGGGGGSQLAGN